MITPDKIKVYDTFGGDDDGLARIGDLNQQLLFDEGADWYNIKNIYQDIHLINNNLASADYRKEALSKMQEQCDDNAYKNFISKINKH